MTNKTPQWQGLFACLLIINCPCYTPAQRPGARAGIPETVHDAAVPMITLPTQDEGEPHVLSPLAESIQVGGVTFDPISPPEPLLTRRDLGLVTAPGIDGHVVHEAEKNLFETRAAVTPAGDYLLENEKKPAEDHVNQLGYYFISMNQFEKSEQLFKLNISY